MVAAMKSAPATPPATRPQPERWRTDAGPVDVAVLAIPPDSTRTRRFEIDCRLVVAARAADARHAMRVEVDGALEWTRRADTANPGHSDSMDYHFRRELPVGTPLRIVVKTEVRGAQRLGLSIEAEEG
jgi:hypothetical protein